MFANIREHGLVSTQQASFCVAMNRRLRALRLRSNLRIQKWEGGIRDHEGMLKALGARNGKRLSKFENKASGID
jgi:hypothetical protein